MLRKRLHSTLATGLIVASTGLAYAGTPPAKAAAGEAHQRAEQATTLLSEMTNSPTTAIPASLIEGARGVLVIPEISGEAKQGLGLLACRTESGDWGGPVYVRLNGMGRTNARGIILVFRSDSMLGHLADGELSLGTDSGLEAGPLGSGKAATNLEGAVYAYACPDGGSCAGMALDGVKLHIAKNENQRAYGDEFEPRAILLRSEGIPADLLPFVESLRAARGQPNS